MARLWHTAILSNWKPIFEYIPIESPIESPIEKFQDEYYDAIARCHVTGESTIFIEFMLSQIDKILDDISVQISEENEQKSEIYKKIKRYVSIFLQSVNKCVILMIVKTDLYKYLQVQKGMHSS